MLSVIITTWNEGPEVRLTCEDILANAGCPVEVIVVADGTTDGSCEALPPGVRVIRRDQQHGVANSRQLAWPEARGDTLMFLDAHMRVAEGAPAAMRTAALRYQSLIVPPVWALYSTRTGAGSSGVLEIKDGRLHSRWEGRAAAWRWQPAISFVAPGWVVPRAVMEHLGGWPSGLRIWGSTEVCIAVAAFYAGVPVLGDSQAHVFHRFRRRAPFRLTHDLVWDNAYVLAKTYHGEAAFRDYWEPMYRKRRRPTPACATILASDALSRDRQAREVVRIHSDADFLALCDNADQAPVRESIRAIIGRRAAALAALGAEALQNLDEVAGLAESIRRYRPTRMIEIGTAQGGLLYLLAPFLSDQAQVLAVDLDNRVHARQRARVYDALKQQGVALTFCQGDSRAPATRAFADQWLDGRQADFLVIDGDHSYEGVKGDWAAWSPVVQPGRVIALHDIGRKANRRYQQVERFWGELQRSQCAHGEIFGEGKEAIGFGVTLAEQGRDAAYQPPVIRSAPPALKAAKRRVLTVVFVHDRLPFLRACLAGLEANIGDDEQYDVWLYHDPGDDAVAAYVNDRLRLGLEGSHRDIAVHTEADRGVGPLRIAACQRFLDGDYDYLLTVDSDIVPGQGSVALLQRAWEAARAKGLKIGLLSAGNNRIYATTPVGPYAFDRGHGGELFCLLPRAAVLAAGNHFSSRSMGSSGPMKNALMRAGWPRATLARPTCRAQHLGAWQPGYSAGDSKRSLLYVDEAGQMIDPWPGLWVAAAFDTDHMAAANVLADHILRGCKGNGNGDES